MTATSEAPAKFGDLTLRPDTLRAIQALGWQQPTPIQSKVIPLLREGRDLVGRFCAGIFSAGRRFDLVPTRANGQPAFGAYLRTPSGLSHGVGLYVLTLSGDRISAMTHFENSVLGSFGLPRSLSRH